MLILKNAIAAQIYQIVPNAPLMENAQPVLLHLFTFPKENVLAAPLLKITVSPAKVQANALVVLNTII